MKKNLIRVMCLLLAICMGLGLVSCGGAAASGSGSSSAASNPASSAPSSAPTVDYSQGLDENGMWEGVKALDYVTLPQYKGMEIPAEEIAAKPEDIQAMKDNLLQPFGTPAKVMEGEIKDGDSVNIDYVGSVDGVEFTGGNTDGKGTTVTIGVTQYIDNFLEQLIGHKPGDTFDVVVTFPEDYNDSTDKDGNTVVLKGKEAVFSTTINYISGEMQFPAFDDEFVSTNLKAQYEWSTAAEAEAGIKESLEEMSKYNFIVGKLDSDSQISEIPQLVIDTMVNINLESTKANAAMYGMDFATFLSMSGFEDEEAFKAALTEETEKAARQRMIYQAIAESESMEVTQEDIDTAFGENAKTVVEQYGMGYVKMTLLADKVTTLLLDEN